MFQNVYIWDNFEELINVAERENFKEHFKYCMGLMFIDKTFKAGKISASEKMRLQDSIELEDRKPKSEENVKDSLKKEFSRLKIEHNRVEHTKDDESKKSDVTSFYTNGDSRSRYNAWKNSPSFGNFKRSNSKPN